MNTTATLQQAVEFLHYAKKLSKKEQEDRLIEIIEAGAIAVKRMDSWIPLLGLLIYVRNRPFTEGIFTPLETLFSRTIAPQSIAKTGRQVAKSTSYGAKTILMSAMIPHFQTLTVCPQFEMTRRFSSNYVRPLLEHSPIGKLMLNAACEKSVLQKTLLNHSIMHFSFAFLDCDRVRGIASDRVHIDEAQDIDYAFIPEILQTTGRSKWRIVDYSGTPKTFDNTMEALWQKSSQAEWLIPCDHCSYINNPLVDADGLKMIGDKTLVCAKCRQPVDGNGGYWEHMKPENIHEFRGIHIPQHILPFHYSDKRNWRIIRMAKAGAIPKKTFYNEILGESCDVGAKLITETDLKRASVLPIDMNISKAVMLTRDYIFRALGVDWGGRGEDTLSFTKLCVLGMRPDGRCDMLYGESLAQYSDGGEEVARVMEIFKLFNCHVLAHDAGGTAGMRDVLFAHSGFPMEAVMPMCYVSAWTKEIITFHQTTETVRRPYYSIDKTKSLILTMECIKNRFIFFPRYQSVQDLLIDFLALIEEKAETRRGGDVYLVRRAANLCDDFAHALNFALMASFHTQVRWPDLVEAVKTRSITEDQLDELSPADVSLNEWEDDHDITWI